jgi:hypothetical protein
MCVSCECCVLSGRGLCDGQITHLEESECDLETSTVRTLWPTRAIKPFKKM